MAVRGVSVSKIRCTEPFLAVSLLQQGLDDPELSSGNRRPPSFSTTRTFLTLTVMVYIVFDA